MPFCGFRYGGKIRKEEKRVKNFRLLSAQPWLFWGFSGPGVVPKWFGGLIYTFHCKKKPPVKFQNSSLPPSKIGQKYLKNLKIDLRGQGGAESKKYFFQNFCLYYFGGHAKFQIPTICPYWGLATAARKKKKRKRKVSES